jgi:hypothetical protein
MSSDKASLMYVRPWNGTDAVARDWRGNKSKRAIYRFVWQTGYELLMFESEQEARSFAQREGAAFIGKLTKDEPC